jgi:outer membrane protein assembly factor BamA
LRYADVTTRFRRDPGELGETIPGHELDLIIAALGPVVSWDTRDRPFSPSKGMYAEVAANFARGALGSDLEYETYTLAVSGFRPLHESNVIAARLYACMASDSAPFFDTCAFGSGVDLRGYEVGRYRDRFLAAVQTEYRMTLSRRFGAVAFAGAGAVAPDAGELGDSDLLASGGLGLRFVAVPSQGVKISLDYAWGKDSGAMYIYIGDAF